MYSALGEPVTEGDSQDEFLVRLHSWNEDANVPRERRHGLFRALMGKRVRVTVEEL